MQARINYRSWVWRVVAWDGLLPLALWSAPIVVCWLVEEDDRGALECSLALTAIFSSFIALGVRLWHGAKYISHNHCEHLRGIQFLCFLLGVAFLWVTDMMLIGLYDEWQDSFKSVWEVITFFAVWYAVYLPFMIVAMYPGREPGQDAVVMIGNWEVST